MCMELEEQTINFFLLGVVFCLYHEVKMLKKDHENVMSFSHWNKIVIKLCNSQHYNRNRYLKHLWRQTKADIPAIRK